MSSDDFYNIAVIKTYLDTLYMYPHISNQVSHLYFAVNNLLEIIETNPSSVDIPNTISLFYGLIDILNKKLKTD